MSYSKVKKVLITGIQNVGKTAIVNVIRDKNLKNIRNLLPTRGANRQYMELKNEKYCIWDLGGVSGYRRRYFLKPELFYSYLDEMLYIFDFQDFHGYKESIDYFLKIIDILDSEDIKETLALDFKLFIFLHKFDPNMNNSKINFERINSFVKEIISLDISFSYEIYKTSIYRFRKSSFKFFYTNGKTIGVGPLINKLLTSSLN